MLISGPCEGLAWQSGACNVGPELGHFTFTTVHGACALSSQEGRILDKHVLNIAASMMEYAAPQQRSFVCDGEDLDGDAQNQYFEKLLISTPRKQSYVDRFGC